MATSKNQGQMLLIRTESFTVSRVQINAPQADKSRANNTNLLTFCSDFDPFQQHTLKYLLFFLLVHKYFVNCFMK